MNKNVIFIIVGALLAAIIVAVTVRSAFKSPSGDASDLETAEILVAKTRISIGKEIKKEDVKWQVWPENAMFKGVIKKSEQDDLENLAIYGQKVRRSIEKGEPVSSKTVIKESEGHSFIAASLGKGMRAVSVPVSAASSAGGFIRPGDRVDVILTHTPKFRGSARKYADRSIQKYASQTVLSNVKVIAVDQDSTKKKGADEKVKPGKTVTLEVSKKGAETVALSLKMGKLSLALRGLGDEDDNDKSSAHKLTTDTMVSDVIKAVSERQKRARTNSSSVRMYIGRDVKSIKVRSAK